MIPEADLTWFRSLKGADRQAMRERAAHLDRLSATGTPAGPVRLAIFAGEADLTESAALAYELGEAGQIVWLYSPGALPAGMPTDFHERVRHINPDPARPLLDQVPPADLFLTADPGLLAAFYRAERTLLYWHRSGTALPDGWAALPGRILTTGVAGTTLAGRPVFPVAPGAAGWLIALAAALEVAAKDPFRGRRPRLSLCMIVKNEEKHLQNCLLSVYGVVDEICIVDTGSTDRTVQIAERLGARVEHRAWRDDFAWARNESLAMATGDWVLHLDADEVLTPEARAEIPSLLRKDEFQAYLVPVDSLLSTGAFSRSYGIRIFRSRLGIAFSGIVHENVGSSINRLGLRVCAIDKAIRHYGYTEDPMRATGKRSRNRDLLVKGLLAEPNSRWYTHYLAAEEFLSGEPEEALRRIKDLPFDANWIDGEPALLRYNIHRLMGQMREALAVVVQGTRVYPRSINLWVTQALLAFGLNEQKPLEEALAWLTAKDVERIGDQVDGVRNTYYLLASRAPNAESKEYCLGKVLPLPMGARALFRHWLRTHGLAATLSRLGEVEIPDKLPLLLQALSDLQDWPQLQMLLEMQPELRRSPAAGSLYLAQGRPEEALECWSSGGHEGWTRYAATVAFMGGQQLLASAEPHVTPLEWLAVQDIAQNRVTWRWAVAVPALCNINNPNLIEQFLARAPFLEDAVMAHIRLNIFL
jgi:hypothetical protein